MKSYIFKNVLDNAYILSDGTKEFEVMLEFYPNLQIFLCFLYVVLLV